MNTSALRMLRVALLLVAWSAASVAARAQDLTRVEAHVTSVSTGTAFLDRGLDAGLRVDDAVTIFLETGFTTDGRVRSATRSSARVELLPGAMEASVGARAEIMIPTERLRAAEDGKHPPWESQSPVWDPDRPLLAPAFGTTPSEREGVTSGHVYSRFSGTFDQQGGGGDYLLASLGLDLIRTNPFGSGGQFDVGAELSHRINRLPGEPDDVADEVTVRRLSYRVGGEEDNPTRWEFGRFLQYEFPELGMLDGVEWTDKTANGSAYGASFGGMPEPYPGYPTEQDVQAALYYRWAGDRERTLTWGAAYQNTWHKGNQDRNLLVGALDWIASRVFSLHAVAWVDYYGPGDIVKPDGFELTEFSTSAAWRTSEQSSVNVNASSRHYPEMQRNEFATVTPEQLLHDHIERIGGGWSGALSTHTRANARAAYWEDQDDHGANYDAGIGWRDLLWERGELSLSASYADGTYSSGPGARISATRAWDDVFATLMYSVTNYDQKSFDGTQTVANNSIFGSIDLTLDKAWELSIYADHRFGDNIDSWDVGLSLQMSF